MSAIELVEPHLVEPELVQPEVEEVESTEEPTQSTLVEDLFRCKYEHLIVSDLTCRPFGVVSTLYALFNPRIQTTIAEAPVSIFPGYEEYAVNDLLIYVPVSDPDSFITLIDQRAHFIPTLRQDLRRLEQLEILDRMTGTAIADRLVSFLISMKTRSSMENGIVWSPANYLGELPEVNPRDEEAYEDYTRRRICMHIKSRTLPMHRFGSIPPDHFTMLSEMITLLTPYKNMSYWIGQSHYAPVFRLRDMIPDIALLNLMGEEFRCVKTNDTVTADSIFIFTDAQLDAYHHTIPTTQARDNLRMYVGDYFDELDLSRSSITGSAITASIICTGRDQVLNREQMISILYPPILTQMSEEHQNLFRSGENINTWVPRIRSLTEGVLTKGADSIPFTIRPGSDVDIAVDKTVSNEEYVEIATKHFETIRKYYPYVKMTSFTKSNGDWNYSIFTDEPTYLPIFRTVEIYRTSLRNICCHHVGAVRGCYTAQWSETPVFYLTASAIFTSKHHYTPNYHYFAGTKSNPQDVIVKNLQRGIDVMDYILGTEIIREYIGVRNIGLSYLPFYQGRKVPYSVFAAGLEYPIAREQLERQRIRSQRTDPRSLREPPGMRFAHRPPTEDEQAVIRQQTQDRQHHLSAQTIIELRRQGIIVETIEEAEEIQSLRQVGLYVNSMDEVRMIRPILSETDSSRDPAQRRRDAQLILSLRRQGVTVNTVEEAQEIQALRQTGIHISSIEEARAYRELISADYSPAASSVPPEGPSIPAAFL